ncbi:MAG: N-acetylmuramoyl-L-alanine amidase [Patescibacteria group bacterium]
MNNTSIVVCGQKFNIGTKVVLWNETGGLNAYSEAPYKMEDRKTGKVVVNSGKRYGARSLLKPNPTLEQLKSMITQFFLHHTGNRTAESTFETLHLERKLSVTFILDDDGTIYQTLDVKEKAWHGGTNNPISIGIEICSRASASKFPDDYDEYHQQKYHVLPRKKRMDKVQGMMIWGYEYNDAQYAALIKLMAKIVEIFPKLAKADFPRTSSGRVIESLLSKPLDHVGFICHYHTCKEKWDPVCLDHQRVLDGIKAGCDQGTTFVTFETVEKKQEALTQLGYDLGDIDGDWGPKSAKALKEFEKDNGLKVDGVWDKTDVYAVDMALKVKGIKI